VLVAGGAAVAYLLSGIAPPPSSLTAQVFTIGVMRNPPSVDPAWIGFQDGMKARGYEVGKNLRYIVDEVGPDFPSTKKKMEALVTQQPDVLYVMGSIAARTAKEVTGEKAPNLPIVFGVVSNPVAVGLVKSVQSPGGNMTGITPHNEVVVSKRLEVFHEMVPSVKRIVFAWSDPATSGIENLRASVKALGLELVERRAANQEELRAFLNTFSFRKDDGMLRATDAPSGSLVKEIVRVSLEKKVPLAGTNVDDAELGALMSYGANYRKIGEQAARLVDAIVKGTKPADLPVELPEEFEFVINMKTAAEFGLTIPAASLIKANRVIR